MDTFKKRSTRPSLNIHFAGFSCKKTNKQKNKQTKLRAVGNIIKAQYSLITYVIPDKCGDRANYYNFHNYNFPVPSKTVTNHCLKISFWCYNAMVMVWLELGTTLVWFRERVWLEFKMTTSLRLEDLHRHGYNNNLVVEVRERQQSWLKVTNVGWKKDLLC